MPIDLTLFLNTSERCIKRHKKDRRIFLLDFRINGKRYRKIIKVGNKNNHIRTNVVKARLRLEEIKDKIREEIPMEGVTLNRLFDEFMKEKKQTAWNQKKRDNFDLYIGNSSLPHFKKESTRDHTKTRKLYVITAPINNIHPKRLHTLPPHAEKS